MGVMQVRQTRQLERMNDQENKAEGSRARGRAHLCQTSGTVSRACGAATPPRAAWRHVGRRDRRRDRRRDHRRDHRRCCPRASCDARPAAGPPQRRSSAASP
jgi:hypothetical protein